MNNYPTTSDEWWSFLENHWDNIINFAQIIGIEMDSYINYDGSILNTTILQHLIITRDIKDDEEMVTILQRIWNHAPDKKWIQDYPGFLATCALCSEYSECFINTIDNQ